MLSHRRKSAGAAVTLRAGPRLLRVLVVDDNRDAADTLAMLVRIWGHDVRRTYDGAAALESASIDLPDVVLLDIGMPMMNGFRLAQQLRRWAALADTVLIAVTGYADQAHRLLGDGVVDQYLVKPVDLSALQDLLSIQRDRVAGAPAISAVGMRPKAPLAGLIRPGPGPLAGSRGRGRLNRRSEPETVTAGVASNSPTGASVL